MAAATEQAGGQVQGDALNPWPRFLPKRADGVLVEVTGRTIGARALLTPGPNPRTFNEIVIGVMGRALGVSPLELCACVWLSNHYHLLVVVREQQQLSRFMQHLACNVSKEVGRLRDWSGPLWARRYDGIVVSDEPDVQWHRLKYLLSHGVKEGLLESPLLWPGVHAAKALVHGEPLSGHWFNRSEEWAARNRGLEVSTYDFATEYLLGFSPLPAFRQLTPEKYRQKVAELIVEIEEEGRAKREGDPVAGVETILSQNPYEPPTRRPKRSARPVFHFHAREANESLWGELKAFLKEYRYASEALKSGMMEAIDWFPDGCYRPQLPFLGLPSPPRPPSPPTRRIEVLESGQTERGAIPVVEIPGRVWSGSPDHPT
ncbi:MAG TPA: hypothetical protein VGG06_29420 [Thermoanaerobaculia bacterium]|jgi:REP element-mobilizing transposase RayT